MNPKELREMLQAKLKAARDICDATTAENRDFTGEERTQVAALLAEAGDLKKQLKASQSDADLRAMLGDFSADIVPPQAGGKAGRGKTLAEQFTEAQAYKDWYQRVAPNGVIPESSKGLSSPPVEFKTLITGLDDTSAGAFVNPDYTGIYEPLGRPELTIKDLISRRQTGSDTVHFVRQTAVMAAATSVPEANVTTYTGATGQEQGLKPEGWFTFVAVTENVKTIAVWVPATKRALSDAAQIRGIIDEELRADLEDKLEELLITGNGVGENFYGIMAWPSGTLSQVWDTDILKTTRKAITNIRKNGRVRPTAWLLNPEDWEAIDLLTDDDGNYMFGGPLRMGTKTLWGLPVVESEFVTQGTGLLADFKKAVLWDRQQASIQVSDSHSDFFIRNMVAFLAEMRAAFSLIRPSAFMEVAMESGT